MKYLWPLMFATAPLLTSAQDYQTVRSDFIHFFLDENEADHGMRMDSVGVEGSDSVLINYLTVRTYDYGYQIEAFVPSWLGEKTIIRPNGENLFFNAEGDTILLKTQAQINESWNLFNVDSISYLEGTITDVSSNVILDSVVEVKTITLLLIDSNDNILPHLVNGAVFVISNTLGIITCPDLYDFPD